jgi:hypothetical protein
LKSLTHGDEDDQRWKLQRSSALKILEINASHSSAGDKIAMLERAQEDKTYGRQLWEHRHRRNRPYTFQNYTVSAMSLRSSDISEPGGYRSWSEVGMASNSFPTPNAQAIISLRSDGRRGAYPLSMTRAATSSVDGNVNQQVSKMIRMDALAALRISVVFGRCAYLPWLLLTTEVSNKRDEGWGDVEDGGKRFSRRRGDRENRDENTKDHEEKGDSWSR